MQTRTSRKIRGQAGFSIIELAIILTIFSFFVVNVLVTEDTSKQYVKYNATHKKLEVIKDALSKYVQRNGHYPCPADGEINITDANIGTPASDVDTTNAALNISLGRSNCNRTNANVHLYATVADPLIAANAADIPRDYTDVIVGAVPVRALELPLDYFVDSFGNRIMYAVRAELTDVVSFGIAINGDGFGSSPWGADGGRSLEVINETTTPITNDAGFVLVSYGADGFGAYPYEQALSSTLPGGATITRLYPPDMQSDGSGSFSAGERDNHHLPCEVAQATNANCTSQAGNASLVFDDRFFIPNMPEISPISGSPIIRYDDVVLYSLQESHNVTGDTTDWDEQNSYQMIPYYGGGSNPAYVTPDGVVGLSLWLDAQDCKTIFSVAGTTDMCGVSANTAVVEWLEKVSIFNNYYRDSLAATGVLGTKAVAPAAANLQPLYIPADPTGVNLDTINGFPSIKFDGLNDYLQLDGPLNTGGMVEDASLRPGSFTVFIVAKKRGSQRAIPTFFSRTVLFGNDISAGFNSNGYSIFGLRDNGVNYDWQDSPLDEIGVGVNDFYSLPGVGVTNRVRIANIAHLKPNAGASYNDIPMIIVARFDDTANTIEIYNGCSATGSTAFNPSITHSNEAAGGQVAVSIGRASITTPNGNLWNGSLNGAIGEIVMYERALPTYERMKITNYLVEKWGITTGACNVALPDVDTDAYPTGCSGELLLGDATPDAASCCSRNWDGANCCMPAYQAHTEKCDTNADCCNTARCSAFGFCYDPSVSNYSY